MEHLLERIEFVTYISLTKKNPKDYSIVVLDEAHTTKYSHEEFLIDYEGRILGLTGTPPRYAFSEKGQMMTKYYPIQYTYTVNEAVEEEILNNYRIFVHKIPLNNANNISIKAGNKVFYTSEAKNYEWLTSQLNGAVGTNEIFRKRIFMLNSLKKFTSKLDFVRFIANAVPEDQKCLIFANTIDQANMLCKFSHHSNNHKIVNTKNIEMFSSGEVTRLSAVEQLSEGITVPNLKHIVIMHSYANEKKAAQKIGRALRLTANETSTIHVLCYENTVDEDWVIEALSDFDESKIKWIRWRIINNEYVKL